MRIKPRPPTPKMETVFTQFFLLQMAEIVPRIIAMEIPELFTSTIELKLHAFFLDIRHLRFFKTKKASYEY